MRFHNDDSNIPDLCIKLIQPPEPTLSDFPAYEKSNKTPSDLCSIDARYENTAPKMSAWIVGFYQKKLLKLIEFGSLSAPCVKKLSAANQGKLQKRSQSCQSLDS
jgi:hypothetical protein